MEAHQIACTNPACINSHAELTAKVEAQADRIEKYEAIFKQQDYKIEAIRQQCVMKEQTP